MTTIQYGRYRLDIAGENKERICYIILPTGLKENECSWAEEAARKFSANIAVISGADWDNDLTPWPAPGLSGQEFGGKGAEFASKLREEICPSTEKKLGMNTTGRYLVGVSLSGIFALWCSASDLSFNGIGSVSGSLWYDGFTDWMRNVHQWLGKRYYFSLGDREKLSRNRRLASVEDRTQEAIGILKEAGQEVFFEYNQGSHFAPVLPRLDKALQHLLSGRQNMISGQEDTISTRQNMTTGQENTVSGHKKFTEQEDLDTIYLAGGCFWGLEKYFKLIRGVTDTQVGFVNGHTENPTYKEVYTDTTGYAECVKVVFDPAVLPLEKLLEFYFMAIDPTSENKQGEDRGTRYRCGIFYSPDSPADMAVIREIHDRKEKEFGRIFVETGPMVNYTPAEEYHQDYLQKNPGGYCHLRPELYEFAAKVNRP